MEGLAPAADGEFGPHIDGEEVRTREVDMATGLRRDKKPQALALRLRTAAGWFTAKGQQPCLP